MYADDTQLYVQYKPSGMIDAVARLEQCIDRVDKWMAASRLKLNSDKSEVIWVGSARTAFVSSRVDYCCSLLADSPRSATDKLQRVLNVAGALSEFFNSSRAACAENNFNHSTALKSLAQRAERESVMA
jgi:hypothetical protein